jgi:hypothetical protein
MLANVHQAAAAFAAHKDPPLMAIDQAVTAQRFALEAHRQQIPAGPSWNAKR